MASNQYLPFGTAGGANVLSPTAYAALAARLSGFTSGTAASVQLNTVWRQSSVVSAMVGKFILDYGGFDALDDGSVDNLETGFVRTLQKQPWLYAVASNPQHENALVANLSPAPTALTAGMTAVIKVSAVNSGPVTLNLNGLGAVSVSDTKGNPLNAGDLQLGVAVLTYSGSAWVWAGRQRGQLLNVRFITTSGNYTPTPGTRSILVELQGAGGAGGGAAATGSGQISGGAGGGAGGYAQKYLSSGFSGVLITIGAGGAPVVGGNGNSGGSTSFGAVFSATGGSGGDFGAALSSSSTVVIGKGMPGAGSGGDINSSGGIGKYAVYATNGSLGGEGGASKFGSGAIPSSGTSSGFPAVSLGSGGGGACLGPSTASAIGGSGANGLAVIWEYA